MDLKKTKPEWFTPEGKLISADARRDLERKERKAAQAVADEVERRTARPQSDSERLLGAQERRIKELRAKLRYALPSEEYAIEERIRMFSEARDTLKAEMDQATKLEGFGKDKRVALARENAEALKRSWKLTHKHASQESIDLALAIAASNDWESPGALADAYWRQLELIAEQSVDAEKRIAEQATNDRLQAEAEEARAQLDAALARKKLNDAKGQTNGD